MAALSALHLGHDAARALERERADENHKYYWNQREEAALYYIWETETQSGALSRAVW
jgi:hypothetical protein